jgi:hypothetical protein
MNSIPIEARVLLCQVSHDRIIYITQELLGYYGTKHIKSLHKFRRSVIFPENLMEKLWTGDIYYSVNVFGGHLECAYLFHTRIN